MGADAVALLTSLANNDPYPGHPNFVRVLGRTSKLFTAGLYTASAAIPFVATRLNRLGFVAPASGFKVAEALVVLRRMRQFDAMNVLKT